MSNISFQAFSVAQPLGDNSRFFSVMNGETVTCVCNLNSQTLVLVDLNVSMMMH